MKFNLSLDGDHQLMLSRKERRRQDRQRMRAKATRFALSYISRTGSRGEEYERELIPLYTKNADHLCACSCGVCRNQRRYSNSFEAMTVQEQRAEQAFRHAIKESADE